MSIFASQTTSDPIPIPFDAPHTITVRQLTGREVELAQAEHLKSLINGRSPRGWSDAFQRLLTKGLGTDKDAAEVIRDPLNGFDRVSVVRFGLMGWSYDQSIAPVTTPATKEQPAVVSDAVADLTDEALQFIATEVMRKTKPDRFAGEHDEKN